MNTPTPIEPVKLEPIDMHGPIEVSAAIYARLPSGGIGRMELRMEPGKIPTAEVVKDSMDNVLTDNAGAGIPPGTRLLTKPEFVAHITKRDTGAAFELPGDQHFVAVPTEIPTAMLVHAIVGVGLPGYDLPIEFTERGLATFTGNQWNEGWSWNHDALTQQPADVLLAIYERITA